MRAIAVLTLLLASLTPVGRASAEVAAPGSTAVAGVRIVNLNLLHGTFCAPETKLCQAGDRVALLGQQLEAADCPEVVGLQEINQNHADLIDVARTTICDGKY